MALTRINASNLCESIAHTRSLKLDSPSRRITVSLSAQWSNARRYDHVDQEIQSDTRNT